MKNFLKQLLITLLRAEAKMVIRRFKPNIVAVTGSVGKTSAKDAIYTVVAQGAYVRKSEKSFNTEFGLPLTILGQPNAWSNPLRWISNLVDGFFLFAFGSKYPTWLVLEVGADRPGDIKSVAEWLPVNIAVLTRLPEVLAHVEFFDSSEAVVEEKASLIRALRPEGTLVLYGDDERVTEMRVRAVGNKVITFGLSASCDVRADNPAMLFAQGSNLFPVGMSAMLASNGVSVPIEVLGALGTHSLYPLLAAAGVGQALGKSATEIASALKSYEPPPGRMHLIEGVKGSLIIDDTYNSSPAAATAALETLASITKTAKPEAKRIAVLGDMLELGRRSVDEHRKLGALAAKTVDVLVTVGFRAREIAQGALDSGMSEAMIFQFEDAAKAGEELAAAVKEGDIALIKGSQSMRMERAVKNLMAKPEEAEKLLVRQDREWTKR